MPPMKTVPSERGGALSIWPGLDRPGVERDAITAPEESEHKNVCFGYLDVQKWGTYTQGEQDDLVDACFAYDEVLKKNGNWVGGEGLGRPDQTITRFN